MPKRLTGWVSRVYPRFAFIAAEDGVLYFSPADHMGGGVLPEGTRVAFTVMPRHSVDHNYDRAVQVRVIA